MKQQSILNEPYSISLPCIRVSQPIGDFYVASIDSALLREITFSDVRELRGGREMDEYLGIQREVNPKRVKEIGKYVNTVDACFPTAVILAIPGVCATYNEDAKSLTLTNVLEGDIRIDRTQIARVLDGQHRIEGLQHLNKGHPKFEVNVSIFIEMDIESQAYIFSVVNLAQTKVSKSLVYDLFEYSKSRSPQKTAHTIAVALDRADASPFNKRIKRLGVATQGRFTETLTQATFVESLLRYLTSDATTDRDLYLRNSRPPRADSDEARKLIFRNMFIEEKDMDIADIIFNYFSAVRERWPTAWAGLGDGAVLNKTNGFRALMRLLRPAYLHFASPGDLVSQAQFLALFNRAKLKDEEITTETYKPGTSGETLLYHTLLGQLGLVA
ncbi:DGQHR domain-containing protein [Stenotrophomonas maltophilia]|uniref:DGQHR domain-containing protein n=1 Tax=Stenotrophomonas TaxID=40323 RepID=UPI0015DF2DF8|nr:DGQHR domain-containing protein [Stenotrophomonas maltophilia]MBA0371138.1 DGQHR domain-containing protein [Stenotrophomonas maltophilia]MBH1558469.1 DGQHR domain-containing protein [Stenotrophomonas maltophilia]